MSQPYESVNLRIPPEAKRILERESAQRRISQSALITELLLRLAPPQPVPPPTNR